MGAMEIIKENLADIDSYKVFRNKSFIETHNSQNKEIHSIDLTFTKVGIFYNSWTGTCTNIQMKEILEDHFVKFYNDFHCNNMLTDCSRMKGGFMSIMPWLAGRFMPELVESGLKNHSIVLPIDSAALKSIYELIKNTPQVKTVAFNSLSEALNWLAMA